MARTTLFLPLLLGCGHISNAPIEEDASFLAALPDEARQALVTPGAEPEAGESGARVLRPQPFFGSPIGPGTHARTATSADSSPLPDGTLPGVAPQAGNAAQPAEGDILLFGPGAGAEEDPTWSEEDGEGEGRADALEGDLPRFSPMAQTEEALATLSASFEQVFFAAETVRDGTPDLADGEERGWDALRWHGGTLGASITRVGDAEFAWAMTGGDGVVFLDGSHAGYPTMETGEGDFRFDQARWAEAYGFDAAGVVAVAYDNRAGVALDLHLDGIRYQDAGTDCDASVSRYVELGPAQRYQRDGEVGDYQFANVRALGCGEEVQSLVRVRWNDQGGRIDERVRLGAGDHWTWSQCWSGAMSPESLTYEHLVVVGATGNVEERVASGALEACSFPDFAEVSAETLAGG